MDFIARKIDGEMYVSLDQVNRSIEEKNAEIENIKATHYADVLQVPSQSGGVQVKRKERMCWYIERICRILQHLPDTQANEIECKALWANLSLGHTDILEKLNTKPKKGVIAMACGGKKSGGKKPPKKK